MAPTAIVVPFRDVPPVVTAHREAFTTDGADGMPPHVTLIYPFVDDADLDAREVGRLRGVLGAFPSFDVTFAGFSRFAGSESLPPVLYLEPEPAQPFLALIGALEREFPAFPPFGGLHETVIPHLTLAYSDNAAALRTVEDGVRGHLPIHDRVDEAAVMQHGAGGWRLRERIPLGAPEGV